MLLKITSCHLTSSIEKISASHQPHLKPPHTVWVRVDVIGWFGPPKTALDVLKRLGITWRNFAAERLLD